MSIFAIQRLCVEPAFAGRAGKCVFARRAGRWLAMLVLMALAAVLVDAQEAAIAGAAARRASLPPRVIAAKRFLSQRGMKPSVAGVLRGRTLTNAVQSQMRPRADGQTSATWQPLGPMAVQSQNYGLVTGRVSALALDPSDATGNTLYVGTTGGGVWKSQNAGTGGNAIFLPLTDDLAALSNVFDASISIGALSVQPGGTGVILAGTGDPNDALDSYYGAGILRSSDGGATWSLIPSTPATMSPFYSFAGEGFAGFAWSTVNPQLVVTAVSQAADGILVGAVRGNKSCEGLYYSLDAGTTWTLATIMDSTGQDVQGPNDVFALPDGNAATAVVWNPVRKLFVAAVRYHGYYQSADGITFTRMVNQPGTAGLTGLTAQRCPTNPRSTGSPGCPIFRGALAVNPMTGDTFAWTVADANGEYNQDQGIWQDVCAASSGECTSQTMTFAQRWDTAALETAPPLDTSIANGDYNLTLAAIPFGQTTLLLAGANDLWKTNCPVSQGCTWRNTTNSTAGFCAQVGEYQHALAWNVANPLEIYIGNDSGLWSSSDGIGETGTSCSASDATHFQNLNGSLGSLAEVVSFAQAGATPYTMMAGLGENGTAGVNSSAGPVADWAEILGGEGGPVAINPRNPSNWYVNNGAGVSIYVGGPPVGGTPGAFNPVLTFATAPAADVVRDGYVMSAPAPFLVDPLDGSKLLIGTCRVWRGPASGVGWSASNAISPIGVVGSGPATEGVDCNGEGLIRTIAAMTVTGSGALPQGGEVVYVGMYGAANGGATLPGHLLSATYNSATGAWSAWTDVTAINPVANDTHAMNAFGMDISSIFIDPHDPAGQTVYVTVAGILSSANRVQVVYGSTDGGVHWTALTSNLPITPANSVVVDPEDAGTVYVATDVGVYSTRAMASGGCNSVTPGCWSLLGSGLPEAPVTQISAEPASASVHNLIAATYGRGLWMTPLWTAGEEMTTASVSPVALSFSTPVVGGSSSTLPVTIMNTGSVALTPSYLVVSGDYTETDNCAGQSVVAGQSCTVQVSFSPTLTGSRTGLLTIYANVAGGQLTVALNGTGAPSGAVTVMPPSINAGSLPVGATSAPFQVTANNSGSPAVAFTSAISGPFAIASNGCEGAVPAKGACNLTVTFTPTVAGPASGTLTFTDTAGKQTVALSGTGLSPATDALSATALSFPDTIDGQLSTSMVVTLTNNGGVNLTSIQISIPAGQAFVLGGSAGQTSPCTATLAANSSCMIAVEFAPTAAGSQSGTLTIADAIQTQTVVLSGTGITPPALSYSPAGGLTFAGQTVGQASQPQTVTVTNTGGAPLTISGFQLTGANAASFSCGATTCSATTCGATLSNVSGQNSCTVQVVYKPATAGGALASLVITSSTAGVTAISVPLSGTGLNPAGLNVNPSQLVFPIVAPGQSSAAQTVTLTNTGGSTATQLSLTATPPFSLIQNTCGTSLNAGASCSTGVVFQPALSQAYMGTLTIASPGLASSASVPLSGTGELPGTVQAQPSSISFTQTGVGLASAPVMVTLTNPSGGPDLTNFALVATANFQLVSNTCAATLAAGASCTVGVEFAPGLTSTGAQSGSLTVSSSALATGATVPLSGVGFDFTVAFSGTSSATIVSGQSASYTLVITPLNGGEGTFTLQCGTLPSYSMCSFNPGSESLAANTTGNVSVKITTGVSSSASLTRPSAWPALPLACGLALVPFALWRRRRSLLLVALLAMLVGGVSSCASAGSVSSGGGGSGGGGGGSSTTTPAGSYSIPVTVSSNGIQHKVTVTLVVD